MGNNQSKNDTAVEQTLNEDNVDNVMKTMGIPIGEKKPLGGGSFFIEAQPKTDDGIHIFDIYHRDFFGIMTLIFSFQAFHPLSDSFNVMYNDSIVKFWFETDSFEKETKHYLKFAFDFSNSFHPENDFNEQLKSMPFQLHEDGKIIHLKENYWYYILQCDKTFEFFIVKSSDETQLGFDSTFKSGDTVIQKINVESKNFPFIAKDQEENFVIASADEGFVSIPIDLPNDFLTISQVLSQNTSQ
jgi:hypothetical protein